MPTPSNTARLFNSAPLPDLMSAASSASQTSPRVIAPGGWTASIASTPSGVWNSRSTTAGAEVLTDSWSSVLIPTISAEIWLGPTVSLPSILGSTTPATRQMKPIGTRIALVAVVHSPEAPKPMARSPTTISSSAPYRQMILYSQRTSGSSCSCGIMITITALCARSARHRITRVPVNPSASGRDLGIQDGGDRQGSCVAEVVAGSSPSPSAQAKPSRPGRAGQGRSSSGALHLDPPGLLRSPVSEPTVTG
jgi:hypothetical protein